MTEGDNPVGELAEDAKRMIAAFGDEVDTRVNKILDERLRVNEEPKEEKEEKESKEGDGEPAPGPGEALEDEPPAPKTFAEKMGF